LHDVLSMTQWKAGWRGGAGNWNPRPQKRDLGTRPLPRKKSRLAHPSLLTA
jgi:hypothetical protein